MENNVEEAGGNGPALNGAKHRLMYWTEFSGGVCCPKWDKKDKFIVSKCAPPCISNNSQTATWVVLIFKHATWLDIRILSTGHKTRECVQIKISKLVRAEVTEINRKLFTTSQKILQ